MSFFCARHIASVFIFLYLISTASAVISQEMINKPDTKQDILALDIEALLKVEVTTVGKKEQALSDSATAVFVITQDDIRKSGVTTIPEALRMAPGIEVARIDANKWAISSRGFNNRFANKLLVMIDGRTAYTPSFSGVYWETQDTVMEDIERIEVIRGPGATLWGANAVNGVINIITKNTLETQGTLMTLGAGSHEKAFSTLRYGGRLNDKTYAKAYIKGNNRDNYELLQGGQANDDWENYQAGGRLDTQLTDAAHFTIQSDFYQATISNDTSLALLTPPYSVQSSKNTRASGANILARWQHAESLNSNYSLQAYYDYTHRDEAFTDISYSIFDLEFQHHFLFQGRHDIVWGLGYRFIDGQFDLPTGSTLIPEDAIEHLYNFFIQDESTLLKNKLWLTIGSKFEHNDYTNWEVQPSARLFWNISPRHKAWSAISHAVRTPSRYERDANILVATFAPGSAGNPSAFPLAFYLEGNKDIHSEELTSYEIGYRLIPDQNLSVDLSVFYNEYNNLNDVDINTLTFNDGILSIPVSINNERSGYSSGIEMALHWQSHPGIVWDLAYNYYEQTINSPNGDHIIHQAPNQNLSLRSNIELSDNVNLNLWLKYTDEFDYATDYNRSTTIDSYITLDARLAWQVNQELELSFIGQNLLDSKHLEYIQSDIFDATEIERGFYLKLLWQY